MVKSAEDFYKAFGAKSLAVRKSDKNTKKELSYLKKILSKDKRILDLACGYGRFTIPLAKQGYLVEGFDISPTLLRTARKKSKDEKLNLKFRKGDMRKLPYKDGSFDIIICMWSAFVELHRKQDQFKAVKEMLRVLDENGFALLDLPKFPKQSELLKFPWIKKIKNNIVYGSIDGKEHNPHYLHTKKTLSDLMKKVGVKKYKIFFDDFGGRERLLLRFWK